MPEEIPARARNLGWRRRVKTALGGMFDRLPSPLQAVVARAYQNHFDLVLRLRRRLRGENSYRRWTRRYDTLNGADIAAIRDDIERLAARPLISVLMPVGDLPESHLRAALGSVLAQLYPHWELCIAEAGAAAPQVARVVAEYAARDPRVRVAGRPEPGDIAGAADRALAIAGGEFAALMDAADILPQHALYLVAREIARHPEAGLVYSDEDWLDRRGRRCEPYFKSDWNPDLLASQDMVSPLGVYRTALVRGAGGFASAGGLDAAHGLALRVTRAIPPAAIRHIPHVLYHRRKAPGRDERKPLAVAAAQRAMADRLDPEPRVSIIVPTRDNAAMLARCVDGLLDRTRYANFEVLVIDNQSADPATLACLRQLAEDRRVRVLVYDHPFNFSAINNWAAAQASGDILVFLNDDTDVIAPDWLRHMAANAMRPEIGAVGAKLLYPGGRVQHAGVILQPGGVADHFHHGYAAADPGHGGRAALPQNLSAVTAACLAMRRTVFGEIGGFDAEHLPVAFNDVDLCLRLRARGYLVAWTPLALLYHHESASRGSDLVTERRGRFRAETGTMRARWHAVLDRDPYFNPNLVLTRRSVALANPPRISYPWRMPQSGPAPSCGR